MVVVEGSESESLKKGPGHYAASFLPGQGELIYVAGHRTTYSAPFARIDSLRPGDGVLFQVPYGTFEYRVTRDLIVSSTAVEVLRSRGLEEIALQACHPRLFESQRYIVDAKPIER
jgi:sortase A